jgi:alkylhydroperoxidase family enzyme
MGPREEEDGMARVRDIAPEQAPPEVKEIFDAQVETYGFVLNTARVYANCPPILRAVAQMAAAIDQSGRIDAGLKNLVNLRVAQINGCPF